MNIDSAFLYFAYLAYIRDSYLWVKMNQPLRTLTHSALTWKDDLPVNFPGVRLPGGNVQSCTGEFGTICLQDFSTADYRIRYDVAEFQERFLFQNNGHDTGVDSLILLTGNLRQEFDVHRQVHLFENQWWLVKAPFATITTVPDINKIIQTFTIWFSQQFIDELLPIFPFVHQYIQLEEADTQLPNTPAWADHETLEYVQSILKCSYTDEWRQDYFDSRVRDLLFKFFVRISTDDPFETSYSGDELEKVQQAASIIKEDISKHLLVPELAKKVWMNEYRFKKVFKMVYRTGPFEYLRNERLKKAIALLEQGLFVKEAAAETGWRPADLIFAYREKFGTTPGKKKQ